MAKIPYKTHSKYQNPSANYIKNPQICSKSTNSIQISSKIYLKFLVGFRSFRILYRISTTILPLAEFYEKNQLTLQYSNDIGSDVQEFVDVHQILVEVALLDYLTADTIQSIWRNPGCWGNRPDASLQHCLLWGIGILCCWFSFWRRNFSHFTFSVFVSVGFRILYNFFVNIFWTIVLCFPFTFHFTARHLFVLILISSAEASSFW